MKFVAIGCFCAGALAAVACADGSRTPTSPSASAMSGLAATVPSNGGTVTASLAASPRSGDLQVTKECGDYHGQAGEFLE